MRKDLFDELLESVKQMKAIEAGRMKPARVTKARQVQEPGTPGVAALRARFGLSQAKFAALLGISVDTLQNWEQERRSPEGPAKVLLARRGHAPGSAPLRQWGVAQEKDSARHRVDDSLRPKSRRASREAIAEL